MNCPHSTTRIELTPAGPHHGKLICVACGRFTGWAPKPETLKRQADNATAFVTCRGMELPAGTRAFLDDLEGKGPKFSPRQQEALNKIFAQYVR